MCANIDVPITAVRAGFSRERRINPCPSSVQRRGGVGYCGEYGLDCAPFGGLMILPL